MIYKYVSVMEIVEKVFRDGGYTDELPWEDLIVWAGESLDLIGAPQQYIRRVTGDLDNPDLDITDYKVLLPCDIYRIEQVAVNGESARYAGNTFHHLKGGDCCTTGTFDSDDATLFTDNFGNEFSNLGETTNATGIQGYTYDINDNYLTLNVQEGSVCIAYVAIPTDDDGYPSIPDDISYKTAVSKYCMMKLDYIEWRRGKMAGDVFRHSEREWLWYCGAAAASAQKPSIDKMESLKEQFVRLMPNIKKHRTFFKT